MPGHDEAERFIKSNVDPQIGLKISGGRERVHALAATHHQTSPDTLSPVCRPYSQRTDMPVRTRRIVARPGTQPAMDAEYSGRWVAGRDYSGETQPVHQCWMTAARFDHAQNTDQFALHIRAQHVAIRLDIGNQMTKEAPQAPVPTVWIDPERFHMQWIVTHAIRQDGSRHAQLAGRQFSDVDKVIIVRPAACRASRHQKRPAAESAELVSAETTPLSVASKCSPGPLNEPSTSGLSKFPTPESLNIAGLAKAFIRSRSFLDLEATLIEPLIEVTSVADQVVSIQAAGALEHRQGRWC